jgi:hypothetical protein
MFQLMQGTLGAFPHEIVRLSCTMCLRKGRYKRANLISRYGNQIGLSDLLATLAGACAQRQSWNSSLPPCGAYYVDLDVEKIIQL